MKPLALLPLTLIATSCFYPVEPPPPRQRPPYYREGEPYRERVPYPPYGPGGAQSGTESGSFEPVPGGNRPPPPDNRPRITEDPMVEDSPQPSPMPRENYPTAKPSSTPGQVISPYAPYNVIDVEGFKSGELVKDPSNKKIFRVP